MPHWDPPQALAQGAPCPQEACRAGRGGAKPTFTRIHEGLPGTGAPSSWAAQTHPSHGRLRPRPQALEAAGQERGRAGGSLPPVLPGRASSGALPGVGRRSLRSPPARSAGVQGAAAAWPRGAALQAALRAAARGGRGGTCGRRGGGDGLRGEAAARARARRHSPTGGTLLCRGSPSWAAAAAALTAARSPRRGGAPATRARRRTGARFLQGARRPDARAQWAVPAGAGGRPARACAVPRLGRSGAESACVQGVRGPAWQGGRRLRNFVENVCGVGRKALHAGVWPWPPAQFRSEGRPMGVLG